MGLSVTYAGDRVINVRSETVGDVALHHSEATAFHGDEIMIVPVTRSQLAELVVLLPSGATFSLAAAVEALKAQGEL